MVLGLTNCSQLKQKQIYCKKSQKTQVRMNLIIYFVEQIELQYQHYKNGNKKPKASFAHIKLIIEGKIKYFHKNEMVYVKVPKNYPEFKI